MSESMDEAAGLMSDMEIAERVQMKMEVDKDLKYNFNFKKEQSGMAFKSYEKVKKELNKNGAAHVFEKRFAFPEQSEFYRFSQASYDKIPKEGSCATATELLLQSKSWNLLYAFEGGSGAIAKLYLSARKHQLVLAFKGSSTVTDWLSANIAGVLLKWETKHFGSACTIADKVREVIEDFDGRVQLFITGHSLGGYLAQIATFSIKHTRIKDGNFVNILPKELEIHAKTIIFDSPPCLDQVLKYAHCNPVVAQHLHLDIISVIKDRNLINRAGWNRKHLGQILWMDSKEKASGIIHNLKFFRGHRLGHYSEYGSEYCSSNLHQVENLNDWRVRLQKPYELPLATFSLTELHRMKMIPFLEIVEGEDYNLKFKISDLNITIFHEKANVFVPKVKYLVREETNSFEQVPKRVRAHYQQSIEKMIELFQDGFDITAMDLQFQKCYTDSIEHIKGDVYIHHSGDFREKILLAQIMQNSIGNFLFMSYRKFKKFGDRDLRLFMANFRGTLAILVEKGGNFQYQVTPKKCQLLIISESRPIGLVAQEPRNDGFEPMNLSHITLEKRKGALDYTVDFFGNTVTFSELCSIKLTANKIRLIELVDFSVQYEEEIKSTFQTDFYVQQDMSLWKDGSVDLELARCKMKDLVTELKDMVYGSKNQAKMLLVAGPGLGKSTYLRVLRKELQQELKDRWVIKINMLDCSSFLKKMSEQSKKANKKKEKVTHAKTKKEARKKKLDVFDLIRNSALPKDSSSLEKRVLDGLLKTKKVFLLLDAFDEVCPAYRRLSESLLVSLDNKGYSFLLTSRPHEIENLQKKRTFRVKTYQLREMDEESQKEFFRKFLTLKMRGSTEAEIEGKTTQLLKALKATKVQTNFWGIPLQALLVARLFKAKQFKIKKFKNLAELFSQFLETRLNKDLKEKLEMNDNNAKMEEPLKKTKESLEKCLKTAATDLIFKGRGVVKVLTKKAILSNRDVINGTGIASVQGVKKLTLAFTHQSFAEYLAAKYLVENLNEKKVVAVFGEILSSSFHQSTRRFFNDIFDLNEDYSIKPSKHKKSLEVLQKKHDEILEILVSENLFQLYMVFNKLIDFKLPELTRTHNQLGQGPPPKKKIKTEYTACDLPIDRFDTLLLALKKADEQFVAQLLKDSKIDLKSISSNLYSLLLERVAKRNFPTLTKEIIKNRPSSCPVERSPGRMATIIRETDSQSSQDFEPLRTILWESGCVDIAASPMDEG